MRSIITITYTSKGIPQLASNKPTMNNFILTPCFALCIGCAASLATAQPLSTNLKEIDVENYLDVTDEFFTPHSALLKLAKKTSHEHLDIPLETGSTARFDWFISIHEESLIDETGEQLSGLAITLSTKKQGQSIDTLNAAHFLTYEGYAKKRSSTLHENIIEICDQTIELLRYSESGDIVGKLSPYRESSCQTTRYLIKDGVFKKSARGANDNEPENLLIFCYLTSNRWMQSHHAAR